LNLFHFQFWLYFI